ncbi:MAG: type II toxin-antitoxin system VapC family toxin [Pseudomonadota bacterium]
MILTTGIKISSISPEDIESVIDAARKFNIDFDDAYHYTIALEHNLTIVSFDKDFDRTAKSRKNPSDIK